MEGVCDAPPLYPSMQDTQAMKAKQKTKFGGTTKRHFIIFISNKARKSFCQRDPRYPVWPRECLSM